MNIKALNFNLTKSSYTYIDIVNEIESCGISAKLEEWHPANFHIYILVKYEHLADYEDFYRKFKKKDSFKLIEKE